MEATDLHVELFGGYSLVKQSKGSYKGIWFLQAPDGTPVAKFWGSPELSEETAMAFLHASHLAYSPVEKTAIPVDKENVIVSFLNKCL